MLAQDESFPAKKKKRKKRKKENSINIQKVLCSVCFTPNCETEAIVICSTKETG